MLPTLLACASVLGSMVSADDLSRKDQEVIVAEYLGLERYSVEANLRGLELLRQLEDVPMPDKRGLARWEKFFTKQSKDLAALPRKAGLYFDKEGEQGRYYLSGQLRRPRGLFVGLHGGGVGAGSADTSRGTYADTLVRRDWVGIFPEVLEKTELGWTDAGTQEWVLTLIDRAIDTFEIDPNHVYLGGHSMGGYGTWAIGADCADRFAALLPSAGAPSYEVNRSKGTIHVMKGIIPNLRNTPMCVFQSTDDLTVGPEANQAAARDVALARQRWGGYEDFEYWEVSDRGHGLPEGGAEALMSKIDGYKRNSAPSKVVWQPRLPWTEQFYWLLWEGGSEVKGTVIAEVDRVRNTVDVRLERTKGAGLCVLLNEDLLDLEKEVTVFAGGIKVFEGIPEPDLATWVRGRALRDGGRAYSVRIPVNPE